MEKFSHARNRIIKEKKKYDKQQRKERQKEGKVIAEKLLFDLLKNRGEDFLELDKKGRELLSNQNRHHMLAPTNPKEVIAMFGEFPRNIHKHSLEYPYTTVTKMREGIFHLKSWINHNNHFAVDIEIKFKSPIDGDIVKVKIRVSDYLTACVSVRYGRMESFGITFTNNC
ncbi:hypothetical protein [Listeria phage List-36]|uniref:Uncharacterized protein n=8 Tax=Pecentumvirus TaxID=1857844 RepID=S4U657_9CAUD|nr:hypothetical protein QLX35_gp049 [Listeria phage LP-125]YP_009043516.1 hypothetical protein HH35_gp143 [Listeria phage List-36]YP_009592578.1 hypothetical protein FDG78_gp049 [Listeria phage LP-064]YP_406514.1 gp138 [Listeria phage P100]QIG60779.1 hypothetical protein vBLinoVEfB7_036 [Listeria phage vB_Lino_VEfB7]QIG60966.1 hypothetical protein vBLivaVAfA18_042 [Listeria phage vB_Liva_VAfA18]QJB22407.1 hypothetical protein [Listeria phage P100plus]QJB22597.1 hypothetical protein [Listeria